MVVACLAKDARITIKGFSIDQHVAVAGDCIIGSIKLRHIQKVNAVRVNVDIAANVDRDLRARRRWRYH